MNRSFYARTLAVVLTLLALAVPLRGATGTLSPIPYLTFFDNSGNPLALGTLTIYTAGTTTLTSTYSDVNLTIANPNPITLNSAGRTANGSEIAVYLTPGVSYKYVVKDSSGTTIRTQDNISSIPASSSGVDVLGTAGEAITAGQCVYLSDGSGAKTTGQWFKCDSANTYSSLTPRVGIAPASIASAALGSIRIGGQVTGLTSLTVGATYYAGTAGAITATAPLYKRALGQADSTTTLVFDSPPLSSALLSPTIATTLVSDKLFAQIAQGRLTLTAATPVTTADVTGASAVTIRYAPYAGNNIALYDGSTAWTVLSFTELTVAVPATTASCYDVFAYNNSGVAALELSSAWSTCDGASAARATALTTQDGVLVKTGATTRRYLGSFRTTTVSGQTEDSGTRRYLWNYNNRVARPLVRVETNDTWNYSTATIRQAGGNTANQVEVVVGWAEVPIQLTLTVLAGNNSAGNVQIAAGIGEDSTTTFAVGQSTRHSGNFTPFATLVAVLSKYPVIGRHFYSWNEWSNGTATTSWFARDVSTTSIAGTLTGLVGFIWG